MAQIIVTSLTLSLSFSKYTFPAAFLAVQFKEFSMRHLHCEGRLRTGTVKSSDQKRII